MWAEENLRNQQVIPGFGHRIYKVKDPRANVVQELAGHSDIRTTRRYYVSVQPELLDEARRAVERSLAC